MHSCKLEEALTNTDLTSDYSLLGELIMWHESYVVKARRVCNFNLINYMNISSLYLLRWWFTKIIKQVRRVSERHFENSRQKLVENP